MRNNEEKDNRIVDGNGNDTGPDGGLPASLLAFCGARLTSGISTMLRLIHMEELVEGSSLVVVGEGTLDTTTIYGKAIMGIGMMCKAKGIPVVALVGSMGKGAEEIYDYGVTSIMSSVSGLMEQDYLIENSRELLSQAAERMFRFLMCGMGMQAREDCLSKSGKQPN